MFYLVGLGLGDATDITVKGLVIVKTASRVYLEAYTSILSVGKDELVSICTVCVICYINCALLILGEVLRSKADSRRQRNGGTKR